MQAVSITFQKPEYADPMQTGRPSKRPRTPFGQRLVTLREAAGLTQAQVAGKLGITQHAYAYWERHPVALRPEQLAQLAAALNTAVDGLMGDPADKKRMAGPSGKARQIFEAVSRLPRRQQEKIFAILEPFIAQQLSSQNKAA